MSLRISQLLRRTPLRLRRVKHPPRRHPPPPISIQVAVAPRLPQSPLNIRQQILTTSPVNSRNQILSKRHLVGLSRKRPSLHLSQRQHSRKIVAPVNLLRRK